MKYNNKAMPKYLYALFSDGNRIQEGRYNQLFLDRKTAREWKARAGNSKSFTNVTIGRFPVSSQWEQVS